VNEIEFAVTSPWEGTVEDHRRGRTVQFTSSGEEAKSGRTNSSKPTRVDTGLPARPKKGVPDDGSTANAKGLPGLIATCIELALSPRDPRALI